MDEKDKAIMDLAKSLRECNKIAINSNCRAFGMDMLVTRFESFGGELHYGVTYINKEGEFHSGWFPQGIFESIAEQN